MFPFEPYSEHANADEQFTRAADLDIREDDLPQSFHDEVFEDNKEGLTDHPLLHLRPDQSDEQARQFARDHGFDHLQELFIKATRITRDPEAWRAVPGLTQEEHLALSTASHASFRQQPEGLRLAMMILCLAAITQGWVQTGSNGAKLNWPEEFHLHTAPSDPKNNSRDIWIFTIVNAASYLAAGLIGYWLPDPLNEYFFGRRGAIFVSSIFILTSVIGGGFTHTWKELLVCRFLLGVAMGAQANVVLVYATEILPSRTSIRGFLVTTWQLFGALGALCGFTANIVIARSGSLGWRLQITSPFIPTIMMLTLIFVCPESPRFLMKRGGPANYAKAYESLVYLRGSPLLAAKELFYVHCQINIEKKSLSQSNHDAESQSINGNVPNITLAPSEDTSESHSELIKEHPERANSGTASDIADSQLRAISGHPQNLKYSVESTSYWRGLWRYLKPPPGRSINYWQKLWQFVTARRIRRATLSASVCIICQQLCGVNVLAFYSSTLFRDPAVGQLDALFLSWRTIGLTSFPSRIPAYWLIDRYGRRFLLLVTTPGLAVTMLAAGLSFNISEDDSARVPVVSLFFFLLMALHSLGMGPVPFTLSAEEFPLEKRVIGMSFAVFLNLFGAGIFALVVPSLTNVLGRTRILYVFAALNMVAFILIFLFVPETAGATLGQTQDKLNHITLEELNYIFSVRSLAHIKYGFRKALPWALKHYIRRQQNPQCPKRPEQHHGIKSGGNFSVSRIPVEVTSTNKLQLGVFLGVREKAVRPGYLRLTWRCKCGRKFHQDIDQRLVDMSPFQSILHHDLEHDFAFQPHPATASPTGVKVLAANGESAEESSICSFTSSSAPSEFVSSQTKSLKNDQCQDQQCERTKIRSRHRTGGQTNASRDRWIIVCFPKGKGKSMEHIEALSAREDVELFHEIRTRYEKFRPRWLRLLRLRDVHSIRLVKFHLRHIWTKDKALVLPLKCEKWQGPDLTAEPDWEYASHDMGIESLPEFMMYIWHLTQGQNHGPPDNISVNDGRMWHSGWLRWLQRRGSIFKGEGLPYDSMSDIESRRCSNWLETARSLRVYMPEEQSCERKSTDSGPSRFWLLSSWLSSFPFGSKEAVASNASQATNASQKSRALSQLGIEAELSAESFWIFNETPRRIRKRLASDSSCKKPPTGWGLWIEEDFIIPWYTMIVINVASVAFLGVAIALSVQRGLTWLSLATYGVAFIAFVFAQWIALTKDSKA